jgi:hypothetical protein
VALRDEAQSARTYAAVMPDNIRRVDELIRGVRRTTAYDLRSMLFIGKVNGNGNISELGYCKVCSGLGLRMLTDAYKESRKAITIDLLHHNNPGIEGFL